MLINERKTRQENMPENSIIEEKSRERPEVKTKNNIPGKVADKRKSLNKIWSRPSQVELQ